MIFPSLVVYISRKHWHDAMGFSISTMTSEVKEMQSQGLSFLRLCSWIIREIGQEWTRITKMEPCCDLNVNTALCSQEGHKATPLQDARRLVIAALRDRFMDIVRRCVIWPVR